MELYDLENTGTLALPGLHGRVLAAELSDSQRISYLALHPLRKGKEVRLRRAYPIERLFAGR
jgi:hypothetical protein